MKKVLAILLAFVMLLGILAGCAKTQTTEPAQTEAETKPAETKPAETKTEETKPAEPAKEEPVTIIWKGWGDKPANYDNVMAALNEKLLADLNIQLQYDFMGTSMGEAMGLVLAGNEDWDLAWTATWNGCNYFGDAETTYMPLDDLLAAYGPDLMATIPDTVWQALRVNGKIYGMPNYQINASQLCIAFQADKMDAAGITIPEQCTSWEQADELFAKIKAAYPDDYLNYLISGLASYPSLGWFQTEKNLFSVTGGDNFFWYYNTDTMRVDWDAWMEDGRTMFEYAKKWNEAGYAPEDMLTLERTDDLFIEGILLGDTSTVNPNEFGQTMYGVDNWYRMKTSPVTLSAGGIASTVIAVNQQSKHPEEAVKLFNYLYANKEAANILFYGLEGQDYEKLDENHIRPIDGGWSSNPWTCGNTFLGYMPEGMQDDAYEIALEMNATAVPAPLFGFVFDPTPVQAEYAAVNDVYTDFFVPALNGFYDDLDTVLQEVHDKAEAAGAQAVEDEMNRQIEAYIAEFGVYGQ